MLWFENTAIHEKAYYYPSIKSDPLENEKCSICFRQNLIRVVNQQLCSCSYAMEIWKLCLNTRNHKCTHIVSPKSALDGFYRKNRIRAFQTIKTNEIKWKICESMQSYFYGNVFNWTKWRQTQMMNRIKFCPKIFILQFILHICVYFLRKWREMYCAKSQFFFLLSKSFDIVSAFLSINGSTNWWPKLFV